LWAATPIWSYKEAEDRIGGSMGKTKSMSKAEIKIGLSLKELISAVRELSPEDREFFIENLVAATNPEYLQSIKEAREDYKVRRVTSHAELFKR
jgi:hypothetical protein